MKKVKLCWKPCYIYIYIYIVRVCVEIFESLPLRLTLEKFYLLISLAILPTNSIGFKRHVNSSRLILCLKIRKSRSLYVRVCVFMWWFLKRFFFLFVFFFFV